MIRISILITFLVLLSCSENKNLEFVKKVELNTDKSIFKHGFSDGLNPFVYFATNDNFKLYKHYLNDGVNDSIDLRKEIGYDFTFYYLNFYDEHYCLSTSDYSNKVTIYNSFDANKIHIDSVNEISTIVLIPVLNSQGLQKDKLLFQVLPNGSKKQRAEFDSKEEFDKYLYIEYKSNPSFVMLDLKTEKMSYSKTNFFDIKPESYKEEILWETRTIFVNEKVLFNNIFYDKMILSDIEGNVEKVLTIESKFTEFVDVDFQFDRKGDERYGAAVVNLYNEHKSFKTQVAQILYDKYRNNTIVILLHSVDNELEPMKKDTNRPFSILVYDDDFNLENEYLIEDSKYNPINSFISKEGIVIDANNELGPNFNPNKIIYETFSY